MKKIIDYAVANIIKIIDSKKDIQRVAFQFILEELDAGKDGTDYVQYKIRTSGIDQSKFDGAMNRSWDDVDGANSPQEFLNIGMFQLLHQTQDINLVARVRITIVDELMQYYKIGRYSNKSKKKQPRKFVNLFKIVTDAEKLHPHFKNLMQNSKEPIRNVLTSWAEGFIDRDKNKFSREFQETFNSSFWELYLFQCFKELEMEIDFSTASPDFTLYSTYNSFNVEAVITNNDRNSNPEWTKEAFSARKEKTHDEFIEYTSIRILNSIREKHKKYNEKYSNWQHVKNRPFIIAIAPFDQSLSSHQNNVAMTNVLFGQIIHHNLFEKDKKPEINIIKNTYILKNGENPIEVGIFTNDSFKEISAVIFSTMATMSKAIVQTTMKCQVRTSKFFDDVYVPVIEFHDNENYIESHLEGLQIFHNPYALHPLDIREFNQHEITHYFFDKEHNMPYGGQNNNTIVSRNVFFFEN